MPSPGAGADSDDPLDEMHLRNIASDALAEVAVGSGGGGGGGSTQDLSRDLDALTLASADSGKASRLETAPSKRAGEAPQDLAPKLAPELNVEGWYEVNQMLDHVPAMVYSYMVDENNENPRFPRVSSGAELVYGVTAQAIMADPLELISRIHSADLPSFAESVAISWRDLTEWKWTGRVANIPPSSSSSSAAATFEGGASHSCSHGSSGDGPGGAGWKWVKCGAMPQRLPNMYTVWYGAVFDVDAEMGLAASEAELTALITAANAPIFQVNAASAVTVCNAKAAAMLGYDDDRGVLGRQLTEFVAAESCAAVQAVLDQALRGEGTTAYELPMKSADGATVEVLLNATPLRDASGQVVGVVGVGQDMTEFRSQAMERDMLRAKKEAMGLKLTHAFDRLNDVVFSVRATSWEAEDWRVYEASKSFGEYFCTEDGPFLDLVDNPAMFAELLAAVHLDRSSRSSRDLAVSRPGASSEVRTLRCRAIDISDLETDIPIAVLIVCHDLTDFKFRIETEKDRQVAARLQHEDKNTHKAQEINAKHALEQLGIIEGQLLAHRGAAEHFESPELRSVWKDMEAVREHSFEALRQAKATMATMVARAQQAQEDSHLRVMMYQLAANEYVPVLTPLDIVAKLHEEVRSTAGLRIRAFEIPEVLLDWTLLRHALENAISNAHKYGGA